MTPPSLPPGLRKHWAASDRLVPRTVVQPLQRFMEGEAAGGIVMLVAAAVALVWANSAFHESYAELWGTHLAMELGDLISLDHLTLQDWVNEGLMTLFFFLMAVEIKREAVFGELNDPRKAAVPVMAAAGGMVVPALVYLAFNVGTGAADGWGIPMATDIAFAVAVVSLAGARVPPTAKVFLLTLAIADDVGAILVIALFYTSELAPEWLAVAAASFVLIYLLRRLEIRAFAPMLVLAIVAWFAMLESGVHATLAGVVIGMLIPARPFYDPGRFARSARPLVDAIQETFDDQVVTDDEERRNEAMVSELIRLSRESVSPLERVAYGLEPWVAYVIVPIFALANAGVRVVGGGPDGGWESPVILGVGLGLLVGKPVGVFVATWLTVRSGLGRLPAGLGWSHIAALGVIAGIGFTVALFVDELAFSVPVLADSAKLGILGASLAAGVLGFGLLRQVAGGRAGTEAPPRTHSHAPPTAGVTVEPAAIEPD